MAMLNNQMVLIMYTSIIVSIVNILSIYDALITWPHFHVFHCSHKNAELIQSQSLAAAFFFRQSIPESTIYLPRRIWHNAIWITSPHTFADTSGFHSQCIAGSERLNVTRRCCNSSIVSQRSLRSFHYAQTRSLISLCHCAAVIFSSFLSPWKFKSLSKECPIPLGGDQIQRLMQRKPRWFCLQPMTCHSHVATLKKHTTSSTICTTF